MRNQIKRRKPQKKIESHPVKDPSLIEPMKKAVLFLLEGENNDIDDGMAQLNSRTMRPNTKMSGPGEKE